MKSHTISVTVDSNTIRVSPDPLVMRRTDEVQWEGKTARRFSIQFGDKTPFDQRELSHDVARGRLQPKTKGRFKYTVVAEDNPSLILDPVIIVEDPPTQSEP